MVGWGEVEQCQIMSKTSFFHPLSEPMPTILQCLLCIVGVVCGAIWLLGVEVVDYRRIIDDLGRYHNLCEIINGELD
jgi:hypothetical protein